MWIKIANTTNIEVEVFSLSNHALSSISSANLAINYKHKGGRYSFYVSAGNSASYSSLDPSYVPAAVDTASIVHLVTRIEFNTISYPSLGTFYLISSNFTFNGVTNATDSYHKTIGSSNIYAPSTWDSSYRLALLRSDKTSDPTDLNVYFLALYGSKLNQRQIDQNYDYGIVNSLPVPVSCIATIDEDGMVGSHYGSPAYYRTSVSATELAVIVLKAFDLDEQLYSPNYNITAPQMEMQVLSLNYSAGSFFFHDGSPLSEGALVRKNDSGGRGVYGIRFRPLRDRHSSATGAVYTTVVYRAIDGITGMASADNATLSIYVTAIDDPPYAPSSYSSAATAGVRSPHPLIGADIDSAVTAVYVTVLPPNGTLYRVASNGSVLSALAAPGYLTRNGSSVFSFAYRYTGSQQLASQASGIIATDIFYFKLEDKEGRSSELVNYTLHIYSALTVAASAYTAIAPAAIEGVLAAITLYGSDTSDAKRNVSLQIVSPPARATLYSSAAGGTPLVAGATLPYGISSKSYGSGQGASVYFLSSGSSFTYPTTSWNGSTIVGLPSADSFTFRALAADGSASICATQHVGVKNVNGPTEISLIYEGEWSSGDIRIYAFSKSASTAQKTSATITGFTISDADRGIDIIRAHIKVSSYGGKVTLNQARVAQLDFSSSTYCLSRSKWQCTGSGYYNSEMIFVGTPAAIEAALNGLKYVSLLPNIVDVINITLYDGVGDHCFTNTILGAARSVRSSCYARHVSIPITVLGYAGYDDEIDSLFASSESSLRTQIIVLCSCAVIALLLCRCAYLYVRRNAHPSAAAVRLSRHILKVILPPTTDSDGTRLPLDCEFTGDKDDALEGGFGAVRGSNHTSCASFNLLSIFGRKSSIRMGRSPTSTVPPGEETASEDSCPSGDALEEAAVVLELQQEERRRQQGEERELLWAEEAASYQSRISELELRLAEHMEVAAALLRCNDELLRAQEAAAPELMPVAVTPTATAAATIPVRCASTEYVLYSEFASGGHENVTLIVP